MVRLTLLLGVAGKVVAQLMGHAHVDTTLNVYTQVFDKSLREAADKVGAAHLAVRVRRRRTEPQFAYEASRTLPMPETS